MSDRSNAPPIRFDSHYFGQISSHLKFLQIILNLISLALVLSCFPNAFVADCSFRLYSFGQLFIAVCICGFFAVLTTILHVSNAFGFPDAFYQFNFPILERLHCLFAMAMYVLGIGILVCTNTEQSFSVIWLSDLAALFSTLIFYAVDYWRRRRDGDRPIPMAHRRIIV